MAYTLLIDGRSGSGKTSLARQIATATGIKLVHLDDFYPGWGGLEAGAKMVADDVLALDNPGFWRWDWERDCAAEWVPLDPHQDLIVEGVGAVTGASLNAARSRGEVDVIVVQAPDALRRERALTRDPGFVDFWQMWAQQEHALRASEPIAWENVADVIVRRV